MVQDQTLWHDERMVTIVRIALRLIEDALRWVVLLFVQGPEPLPAPSTRAVHRRRAWTG